MKKLSILNLLFLVYISGNTQVINHPQSFDEYGWGEKNSTNVLLSIGKWSESYIVNYDLSNGDFTYLNDSSSLRLGGFNMIGDTGVATTGTGNVYYTHNNWATISQSTSILEKIIKTNSGFLGKKSISGSAANYYHSVDGNTWTLVINAFKGDIAYKDGKTWIASQPNNYQISYDGGLTFINKTSIGSSSTISEFIPFDTLSGIAIVGPSNWYYTTNGGTSSNAFPSLPSTATFIYARNLDTIYANLTSTGVNMTLDTGNTWQPVSIPLPNNSATRMYPVGNHLVNQTTNFYSSQGIGQPWTQLHKKLGGGNDVSFYNNKGIIVTGYGDYFYSNDKGKTYYLGGTNLGSGDLRACEFVNDSIILVGDRQSNIWVSKNGGTTWNKNYSNSFNYISRKFRTSADLSTMVLFRNGQNVMSTNQGGSWSILGSLGGSFDGTVTPSGKVLIVSGGNILEMNKSNGSTTTVKTFTEPNVQGVILEMVDDNNGYAIAKNTTDTTTVIFRTTDGWATYTKVGTINTDLTVAPNPVVPSFTITQNLALNIIAPDTLYINRYNVTDEEYSSNVIYKSFDGGFSWSTDSIVPYKQGGATDKLQNLHYFAAETFISAWGLRIVLTNNDNPNPISIKEYSNKEDNSINIYPNPFSSGVNIHSEKAIYTIKIYDISGKLIRNQQQVSSKNQQLDLQELNSGIYFIAVELEDSISTYKIIKQ